MNRNNGRTTSTAMRDKPPFISVENVCKMRCKKFKGNMENILRSLPLRAEPNPPGVCAIVLAAGLSRRMGRQKMLLPWGKSCVIRHGVEILEQASLAEILAVRGGTRQEVEAALSETAARTVFSPAFEEQEMLASVQTGLRAASPDTAAALIVRGDQPQIELEVVCRILDEFQRTWAGLIIPSYQRRRGHPWLAGRTFWQELLELPPDQTLRSFLDSHSDRIHYLELPTASILKDLDTPQDWESDYPASLAGGSE